MTETHRADSVSDLEPQSEELLMEELEKYPRHKLSKDDVYRVAQMVYEYQGKIKAHLHEQQEKQAGRMDRFADRVANFGGSWRFVAALTVILTVWLIWDHGRLSLFMLSFGLSVFTVFQAALIQMSQNRQAKKDKQEQMLDIAINYTAEQENLDIQDRLARIDERLHAFEKSRGGGGG